MRYGARQVRSLIILRMNLYYRGTPHRRGETGESWARKRSKVLLSVRRTAPIRPKRHQDVRNSSSIRMPLFRVAAFFVCGTYYFPLSICTMLWWAMRMLLISSAYIRDRYTLRVAWGPPLWSLQLFRLSSVHPYFVF